MLANLIDWTSIIAVVSTILLGIVGVKYRKYVRMIKPLTALIQELSAALEPDADGKVRITKAEIKKIIDTAQMFIV